MLRHKAGCLIGVGHYYRPAHGQVFGEFARESPAHSSMCRSRDYQDIGVGETLDQVLFWHPVLQGHAFCKASADGALEHLVIRRETDQV